MLLPRDLGGHRMTLREYMNVTNKADDRKYPIKTSEASFEFFERPFEFFQLLMVCSRCLTEQYSALLRPRFWFPISRPQSVFSQINCLSQQDCFNCNTGPTLCSLYCSQSRLGTHLAHTFDKQRSSVITL